MRGISFLFVLWCLCVSILNQVRSQTAAESGDAAAIVETAEDPEAEEEINEYASAPSDENQWLWMDLLPNATANYSLGGSFQVGTFLNKPTLWVKLCLKLPENHINMSAEHEKQFHMSIYIQFNDMNMRLLSLKSFQNVECRKRGYF